MFDKVAQDNSKEEIRAKILEEEILELDSFEKSEPLENEILDYLSKIKEEYDLTEEDLVGLRLLVHRINNANMVNAVIPIYCHQSLDREKIYQAAIKEGFAAKKHEKFTGVAVKCSSGSFKFTAIYFNSGSINCVGVKDVSPEGIQRLIQTLKRYNKKLIEDYKDLSYDFRIANRVLSLKIPLSLRLDHLHLLSREKYWREVKYQAQIFPGLISQKDGTKAKLLFFRTGSLIMTGIKSTKIRLELTQNLCEKIGNYLASRKKYLESFKFE